MFYNNIGNQNKTLEYQFPQGKNKFYYKNELNLKDKIHLIVRILNFRNNNTCFFFHVNSLTFNAQIFICLWLRLVHQSVT